MKDQTYETFKIDNPHYYGTPMKKKAKDFKVGDTIWASINERPCTISPARETSSWMTLKEVHIMQPKKLGGILRVDVIDARDGRCYTARGEEEFEIVEPRCNCKAVSDDTHTSWCPKAIY